MWLCVQASGNSLLQELKGPESQGTLGLAGAGSCGARGWPWGKDVLGIRARALSATADSVLPVDTDSPLPTCPVRQTTHSSLIASVKVQPPSSPFYRQKRAYCLPKDAGQDHS